MNQKTSSVFPGPSELSDDKLLERLLDLQQRTRGMLMKYQLKPASFSAMARIARRSISNTEELSELFELFINLQEFGAEAKQRKVLNEASITQSGEQSKSAAAASVRRREGGADLIEAEIIPVAKESSKPPQSLVSEAEAAASNEKASRDFFSNLDK